MSYLAFEVFNCGSEFLSHFEAKVNAKNTRAKAQRRKALRVSKWLSLRLCAFARVIFSVNSPEFD
jgi:hypothetical protein